MKNIKYNSLIDFLMFINILFIGSDIFAINIANYNFRLIQLVLLVTTIIIIMRKQYKIINIITFTLFLISNILSLFVSYNVKSSISYFIWTIYNYIFVLCLFYSWARERGIDKVYKIWRKTFFLQGYIIIIQFIMLGLFNIKILNMQYYKGVPRPAIWFYEPSYAATYFIIFFTISLFMYISTKNKTYRNDLIWSFLFIGLITSTTGFLGVAVSILVCLLMSKMRISEKIKIILRVAVVTIICGGILYIIYPNIFIVFIGRLFTNGIYDSSGTRMQGWNLAYEVFSNHKILGIGANTFELYTGSLEPPTNVTLEVLCYFGISGFITLGLFITNIIIKSYKRVKKLNNERDILMKAFIIAFIVFLIVLQANQNYLRLYMWMQMGLILGITNNKSNNSNLGYTSSTKE